MKATTMFLLIFISCLFLATSTNGQPDILLRRLSLVKTGTCRECRDLHSQCRRLVNRRSCNIRGRQILKYICSASCPNVCQPCPLTIRVP
uniref:Uncharacterized protein n=1 Tax=Ciona intestinalis TaxID=7719 RepID=F6QN78_CIOIN